ncbi:MAG: DNA polymerase III subunit gamma/tau C-terminal domain-containing protein, partial [Shewanella sp.]
SMRDALSLTDQAIAFGGGTVMLTQVQTMLGSIDAQHVLALLKALTDADIGVLMQTCAQVLSYGADAQEVLRSLLELLHQITLTQFAPAAAQQSLYTSQIRAFAEALAPEQVQLYYQILLTGRKDLPFAPDPKSGLEMALLRAVAFVPEKSVKRWQVDTPAEVDVTPCAVAANATAATSATAAEKKTAGFEADAANPLNKMGLAELAGTFDDHADAPKIQANDIDLNDIDDNTAAMSAELAELAAQQQVIMSQAESQGFQGEKRAAALGTEGGSTAPCTERYTAPASQPNTAQDPALATGQDSAPADELFGVAAQDNQDINEAYLDYAEHGQYAQAPGYGANEQAAMAYLGQDVQPYFQEAQQAAHLEANQEVSLEVFQEVSQKSTAVQPLADNSIAENSRPETASVSLEDDDILSAVLAARDSLLSELDALSAKDGEPKKPVWEQKAAASLANSQSNALENHGAALPAIGPVPSGPNAERSEHKHSDHQRSEHKRSEHTLADGAQRAAPKLAVNPEFTANPAANLATNLAPTAAKVAVDDRPPWEEAPDFEPVGQEAQTHAALVQALPVQTEPAQMPQTPMPQTRALMVGKPSPGHARADGSNPSSSGGVTALTLAGEIHGDPLDLHWYKLMARLDIGGRVRQLAVNSVCQALSEPLPLLLKPDQKHLAADVAIAQLEQALSQALGQPRRVQVAIGSAPSRETPLELRKRFHQELLQQAQQSLLQDDNVQWLIQRFGAELVSDTLVYPPQLLNQRSEQIIALPDTPS